MLADYLPERQIEEKELEEYLKEQKEKGKLEEVTNNGDGTITVEVDGYEITIKDENLSVIKVEKAGGVRPQFTVITTKENGDNIIQEEEENLTKKAITIHIMNIAEYGENYTIEVMDERGNKIEKETNVITGLTGQASFVITKSGKYTITVSGTKDGLTRQAIKTENIKLAMEQIEESQMFSKSNGVIDIVWLDLNNNVIQSPISPAEYLGGLEAIKYNGIEETKIDHPETDKSWYHYVEQTGTTENGGTSQWANARSSDGNAYFVWIPRYAYKITYFNNADNAQKYRQNNSSTEGIVGYSTIEGIIDVVSGTPKLIKGSKPTNVDTSKLVNDTNFADYIPHPAFEFDGSKAGIWIGKFESSKLAYNKIGIVPNKESEKGLSAGNAFTKCLEVKNTYNLEQDSHLIKNIEWGAVAYLTESKYGRNGTEVTKNSSNYYTGGGNNNEYKTTNAGQSTTGNIYGIYDMNGTSWEYVAGVNVLSNGHASSIFYDFTNVEAKYYDIYKNYSESKGIKGDGIYETSISGNGSTGWHQDFASFLDSSKTILQRGGRLYNGSALGLFSFDSSNGNSTNGLVEGMPINGNCYRVALTPNE